MFIRNSSAKKWVIFLNLLGQQQAVELSKKRCSMLKQFSLNERSPIEWKEPDHDAINDLSEHNFTVGAKLDFL